TKEGLAMLGILTGEEYESLAAQTRLISGMIRDELARFGCELYDIKLEFGRCNGEVRLIDEISGGNMRVFKDGKSIEPMEITRIVTGD
ncbi:MAG: phosphoribosylaminoimidazolesuccinocarboxamide synthase, partial [Oscillospiraceae bacterium]|nr:phosphoribosylaminoimidazolesuccinocarboxamide synthase [Oscillospiraceae bacterium]